MFQMLSSGAQTLVYAEKRGTLLTGIATRSMADMLREHHLSVRNRWHDNIVTGLAQIKAAAVSDTFPCAIAFAGATISLRPRPAADSILPRVEVVRQLLAFPAAASTELKR